ncbi:U2 small nuclear ribonucleoprotein auxiliary factor 35 kDa subunit-related protein 2 [Takifugu rubripes]|uniref:U2 small nuclear ribonucleoprotein auxiliary factor subunit-related protein n=1 Tax=Takifugu rubripes TaxID=31033 RepID=Q9W6Q9_TAKRU|nr:U2 small nuclear ribonucleoprotein auxiliary factor 35 kDa subunit-related protein 2 [Takifugu rubripes]AAD28792.1 U2 small nuclear ribonucleoprotein auxiliary factor subunit-related protein [Takifugu rubripes]|eukprot:XP_003969911.1 PREDICTED: U2 small nuclear ribonucleoprotein auxiliary factor 35 kDa subunit-related protein 2 [Takifugu rubripes]
MAVPTTQLSAPVFSQKQRKVALRKERRKRKRQALAQARDHDFNNGDNNVSAEEKEDEDNDVAELERQHLHEEWMEKERVAQEEFRLKREREEAVLKRKEEEERIIKEEWEAQRKREEEEKEQKQLEKRDREEAVQKMLDEAENQLQNGGPWMNPEAPLTVNSENYGTERDVSNCPFFLKTGSCRFGDRCSRKHVYPTASPTMMIRSMFKTFGMEEARRDDYDIDACLEHSEEELYESFLEFYHDVLPEFKSVGKVLQFKVSCNHEPHLRGNVYVQFETEEQCKEAFIKFNGRWYAGRQLHCEMCPVTRWKNAICGLFDRQKCPKGKHCNFLHVFRNPGKEFWEADRDLHMSPDRSVRGSQRDGRHSERYGDRWQRRCSRSPPRSERSHSRRAGDRWSSRSRESAMSHPFREDRSSRSRHSDRRNDWYQSRSTTQDRETDRLRRKSKDGYRNRSEERYSRGEKRETRSKERGKSRSSSREGKRTKRSRERSPKKRSEHENNGSADCKKRRHHKRTKKSKKKSKKHKKRSRVSDAGTSSAESDTEKESPGEIKNLSERSPSQETPDAESLQNPNEVDGNHADSDMISPVEESKQPDTEVESQPAGEN